MSLPDDQYVGEPAYPAPWSTRRPREGMRDTDAARIVSLAPDVCLTPVGSSVVPVPYPVVDFAGHDDGYTPSVRMTGHKSMVLRSRTSHVHGDAPGVRKGVKSGTVGDVCEPIGHAGAVRAEGSNVIRHLDRCHMNAKNTQGECLFVRDQGTHDAPDDTDPVPGSLRMVEKEVSADEAFEPFEVAFLGEANQFLPKGGVTPVPSGKAPAPTVRKPPSMAWGRFLMLRGLGMFGVAYEGYRLGEAENERARADPESYMAREARRYGGVANLRPGQLTIHERAIERLRNGAAQGRVRGDYYQAMEAERRRHGTELLLGTINSEEDGDLDVREQTEREKRAKATTAKPVTVPDDPQSKNGARVAPVDAIYVCLTGTYADLKKSGACVGEIHHIIPDRTYRIDGDGGRIPGAPSYGEGQAICLTKEVHRLNNPSVHNLLDKPLGGLNGGKGYAKMVDIRAQAFKFLDEAEGITTDCIEEAKMKVEKQTRKNNQKFGRTSYTPPKTDTVRNLLKDQKFAK